MKRRSDSVCALVSGGLDSTLLLYQLARRYRKVFPVYVAAGMRWERAETFWLQRWLPRVAPTAEPLRVTALPMADVYQDHWSVTGRRVPGARTGDAAVYLPGRGLVLLSKAAVFCALHGIGAAAIGTLRANPFPDSTPGFDRSFRETVRRAMGHDLRILRPLSRLSKADVIRRGRGLPLGLTFSCINPKEAAHCGRCNKCAERARGFRGAGVPDPTRYAAPPRGR